MNETLPRSYVDLERLVLNARATVSPPVMTLRDEFAALCLRVGIEDARSMATFLHSTGKSHARMHAHTKSN